MMLANLSQSPQPRDAGDQGVSVGEGLAPVPKKLTKRIWKWKFIEMGGPATRKLGGQGGGGNNQPTRCGVAKTSDYGRTHLDAVFRHVCVSILSRRHPESVPELLVYTSYLAGIWYTQIAMGLSDPKIADMQQLEYIIRGFCKLSGGKGMPTPSSNPPNPGSAI